MDEPGRPRWWMPAALVLATVACYANSLDAPWLFDDKNFDNPLPFRSRPIVRLSLELCRAIGGTDTRAFHAFNVLVHACAGLLLFGIVRRSLHHVRASGSGSKEWLAWSVALLWLVHPLQTESVSYVSQRAESLAGLFYLGVFYAFVRTRPWARGARSRGAREVAWSAVALTSFALGLATKEIVATAPVLLLLFDRTFFAGSFRAVLRTGWRFHAALLLVGATLFAVLIGDLVGEAFLLDDTGAVKGYGVRRFTALEYARTQPGVILHYLRLAFWPHPLCLDYWWLPADGWREFVPQTLFLALLLAVTVRLVARRSWLGFAGAWFFVILAPTSSIVPIQDAAFEHRNYLSLAAVVLGVVVGAARLCRGLAPGRALLPGALLALAATTLGALTVLRNRDYRSAVRMWETVVERAPHNPRGHANLGRAWIDRGETERALECFERSLELKVLDKTLTNLGSAHALRGDLAQAEHFFRRSLEMDPGDATVHFSLGNALRGQDRISEAIEEFATAVRLDPDYQRARVNLGSCLLATARPQEALRHFQRALALPPETDLENVQAARALLALGRADEAIPLAERAAALSAGKNAEILETLGEACSAAGELGRAVDAFERALAVVPAGGAGNAQRERLRARLEGIRRRLPASR